MGIVSELPRERVEMLMGNELAEGKVEIAYPPRQKTLLAPKVNFSGRDRKIVQRKQDHALKHESEGEMRKKMTS